MGNHILYKRRFIKYLFIYNLYKYEWWWYSNVFRYTFLTVSFPFYTDLLLYLMPVIYLFSVKVAIRFPYCFIVVSGANFSRCQILEGCTWLVERIVLCCEVRYLARRTDWMVSVLLLQLSILESNLLILQMQIQIKCKNTKQLVLKITKWKVSSLIL